MISSATVGQAASFSFHDMLAPGGVDIGNGVIASAQLVFTGSGAGASGNGDQGAWGGGPLNSGFDVTRDAGSNSDAIGIRALTASVSDGLANDFADSIGFSVSFSSPTFVEHFYGADIDGQGPGTTGEWMMSFGFDGASFVEPTVLLDVASRLTADDQAISTSLNTDLGLTGGQVIDTSIFVARQTTAGGASPNTGRNQALFVYDAQVTDLYFLYGAQGSHSGNDIAGAGVSGLFVADPVVAPVPLPAASLLLLAAIGGLGAVARRRA